MKKIRFWLDGCDIHFIALKNQIIIKNLKIKDIIIK